MLSTDFQIFKSVFLKINFSPICYDIRNNFAIFQECNVRFQFFFTKIEMKERPFGK